MSDKYSPNLAAWLVEVNRFVRSWGEPKVFFDQNNAHWIGWIDSDDFGCFIGAKLMTVLALGGKAQTGWHAQHRWQASSKLTEIPDFWRDYKAIGRCAIDRDHSLDFVNSDTRWTYDGDSRSCNWCGQHTQQRQVETVELVSWEPVRQEKQGTQNVR